MAISVTLYNLISGWTASSTYTDELVSYLNIAAGGSNAPITVDPAITVAPAPPPHPGEAGYIYPVPGSSFIYEQVLVNIVPSASSVDKAITGSQISMDLNSGYNMTGASSMINLSLPLTKEGSGTIPKLANVVAASHNSGSGAVTLMENADFQVHALTGSSVTTMQGFHAEANVESGATVTNVYSFLSDGTLNGTITNYSGLVVQPSGSAAISGTANGIYVSLNGLSGIPLGSGIALSVSNGKIYSVGTIPVSNNQGVTQYNLLQNGAVISNNTSGTSMFVNDFGGSLEVAANKTFTQGSSALPITYAGFTSGSRLLMNTGSSMDSLVSNAAGFQVAVGNVGTVTDATMFLAGIFKNLASTGTITNAYGFRVMNSSATKLSAAPVTNAWGISIEDLGAENYLAKSLAIGTDSKKVASSNYGLEIQDVSMKITSAHGGSTPFYEGPAANRLATTPVFTFTGFTNSVGMYMDASNRLSFADQGNQIFTMTRAGGGLATLGFGVDLTHCKIQASTNILDLQGPQQVRATVNGSLMMEIYNDGTENEVDLFGALVLGHTTVPLTVASTSIPTLQSCVVRLQSDNATPANRVVTFATNGSSGQILILINDSANGCKVANGGSVHLTADWAPTTQYSTLSLVSNGSAWMETARTIL